MDNLSDQHRRFVKLAIFLTILYHLNSDGTNFPSGISQGDTINTDYTPIAQIAQHILPRHFFIQEQNAQSQALEIKTNFAAHATATAYQKTIYSRISECLKNNKSVYLNGSAGTGKTFLLNRIISDYIDQLSTVAVCATTGIASKNLIGNSRTIHSRFKLPLDVETFEDTLTTNPPPSFIKNLKLIVIDEISIANRFMITYLDNMCRTAKNNFDQLFGGITVLFAGDFCQLLPIVPFAYPQNQILYTIYAEPWFKQLSQFTLTENMRVSTLSYQEFLVNTRYYEIDRVVPYELFNIVHEKDDDPDPSQLLKDVVSSVFDFDLFSNDYWDGRNYNDDLQIADHLLDYTSTHMLISFLNDRKATVNSICTDLITGQAEELLQCTDHLSVVGDNTVKELNEEEFETLPIETKIRLRSTELDRSLIPRIIKVKKFCPLIIKRNLNPLLGLTNGTRVIFDSIINRNTMKCYYKNPQGETTSVLIPRIPFEETDFLFPTILRRNQFPVAPGFCVSVHGSQGLTLDKYAIFLHKPFASGILYTALSRTNDPSKVTLVFPADYYEHDADESEKERNIMSNYMFKFEGINDTDIDVGYYI